MAKKIPSNFYQEVNIRKLDKVFSNEGDLPTPSVSDEGKVIKVNNEGKYALLPDGGAHTMTVAITYDETTDDYSADKTHADIIAALQAGVIVKATYDNLTFVYAGTNKPAAFDGVYFTYIQADSEDQLLCKCFEIDSDNRIVYSSHNISEELPIVDTSDNGKILGVDQGVWTPINLPSELPSVTSADNGKKLIVENGIWTIDNSLRIIDITANTIESITRTVNSDGSITYEAGLTVSSIVDEFNTDISSLRAYDVNPNTLFSFHTPFGNFNLPALSKLSNYRLTELQNKHTLLSLAFPNITTPDNSTINGCSGVAKITLLRITRGVLSITFDMFTSTYPST